MDHHCQKCGDYYTLRFGCEPTTFCDTCAQSIIARLEILTPEPPNAITYECGVEILNALQKELYDLPHRTINDMAYAIERHFGEHARPDA